MGPPKVGFNRGRFRDSGVCPGQVPVLYDGTDPRSYRYAVVDWLAYQNCFCATDSDYMSHEKRLRALICCTNGRVRRRLDNFVRAIPSPLPARLFNSFVNHLLEVVDPTERHTDSLAMAHAWKSVASTRPGPEKSLDEYWMSFTDASDQYTHLRGDVARTVGCREVIALTCLHNVGLPRVEWNVALRNALRWQEGANEERRGWEIAAVLKRGSLRAYSASPPAVSASPYDDQRAPSPATRRAAATEANGNKDTERERTRDVVALDAALLDLAQECNDALNVAGRLHERLEKARESTSENLKSELNQSRNDLNRIRCHLDVALAAIDVMQAKIPKLRANMKSHPVDKRKGTDGQTSEKSFSEPLITLDAVRVALRALDAGNHRQKGTTSSFLTHARQRRATTARVQTELKCYECGEVGHKWWEKSQCKRKHYKRRSTGE